LPFIALSTSSAPGRSTTPSRPSAMPTTTASAWSALGASLLRLMAVTVVLVG
jgi:hypothetical protein